MPTTEEAPGGAPARREAPSWLGTGVERLTLGAATLTLAAILVPLLLTSTWRAAQDAQAQRDRYGSTVVERLAASAGESLLGGDRIGLSVLTRSFTALDGVATAAVYSADNRLLAAADAEATSPAELEARPAPAVYVEQITLQDSIAGYARIGLDRAAFRPTGQWLVVAIGLTIAVLILALAKLLGARAERRLQHLRERLEADMGRQAQAGDALDALTELLDPPAPAGAHAPAATKEAADGDPRRPLYVVVVNLFNQISLSSTERSEVLERCETLLDRVCRLYGGRHERLPGTGLLIVLDALSENGDHAFQAICAALLAARVFEDLNHDRRREGAVQLALRIGVERIVEESAHEVDGHRIGDRTLIEDFPETVTRGVTLSALARERSVAIGDAVRDACPEPSRLDASPLQSPVLRAAGGGAWLVHDLAEGYRGLLDRQAQLLLSAP
ncbi:MAG TPA: hypothetical protein VLA56_07255 [Pseudomonadales bacterium]|nr:hypothetical protein [Pseudomonadales bacterium]